jgi:hypothetical protein
MHQNHFYNVTFFQNRFRFAEALRGYRYDVVAELSRPVNDPAFNLNQGQADLPFGGSAFERHLQRGRIGVLLRSDRPGRAVAGDELFLVLELPHQKSESDRLRDDDDGRDRESGPSGHSGKETAHALEEATAALLFFRVRLFEQPVQPHIARDFHLLDVKHASQLVMP